jgi:hypothetical protein
VSKLDAVANGRECGQAVRRRDRQWLQLQTSHQIVEKQVALVEPIQAVEQRSDRTLGLSKDPQEHSHVTQRDDTGDRTQDDPRMASVSGFTAMRYSRKLWIDMTAQVMVGEAGIP